MILIHPSQIKIRENRMRRVFGSAEMAEMKASILSPTGLIHAPTVEFDGEEVYLVAGERRLRNINEIIESGLTFRYGDATYPDINGLIPATPRSELDEATRLAIEFEENAIRVDLDFRERALARARLHELRCAEAEREGRTQTLNATATEIAGYPAPHVRADIQIAKHFDDPDVAKAKSQKEAIKILERKQRAIFLEELAQRQIANPTKHTLHHGDSLEFMRTLPPNSVDLVITDPPYGINAHTMSTQSGSSSGISHEYEDSPQYAETCITTLSHESFRFCKPDSTVLMFCDIKLWHRWVDVFRAEGFYVWPVPLIWRKRNAGSLLGSANGPRHVYEAILLAQKGRKPFKVSDDVLETVAGNADLHPANKPHELLTMLFERASTPGDVVFDAFCGSGGIFAAAEEYHCTAIGCELSSTFHAIALNALHSLGD